MGKPHYPALYEINTRAFLSELSAELGRPATLDDIPDTALDRIAELGFDWVWFLGMWQTGPAGRQVSLTQPQWHEEYRQVLPDFHDEDVCGSPFAVRKYVPHADFGGRPSLTRLRKRLRQRGLSLMLDFVVNHTALDYGWISTHPAYYVQGTEQDLAREPHNYWQKKKKATGRLVFAHGRDPYFPGWPDTLQLNYRHAGLYSAMIRELQKISRWCDGLRCDMAMLVLPEIFQRTWGARSLPSDGTLPLEDSFWPEAIAAVRANKPDFVFMAEVYWDLEWRLQQLGFDYTYDKRLYDRLMEGDAQAVRAHLGGDAEFQGKLVRFVENHDEPRIAGRLTEPVHKAAAVATFFLPGLRLFHEGELEGRRIKASLHLRRRPVEPTNPAIGDFYAGILRCLQRSEIREGNWHLLECRPAWQDNPTWEQFIGYAWEQANKNRILVAVNYASTQGQCLAALPFGDLRDKQFTLRDLLSPARYDWHGDDLANGLFLDMPAWGYHVFEMIPHGR